MLKLRTYETRVGTHRALDLRASSNSIFKTAFRTLVIGVMAVGFVPLANASLIGDSIIISSGAGENSWTDTVVVGAGIEMLGVDDILVNPTTPNGSSLQHTSRFLSGGSFNHLYAGDFYDIGANSIRIVYAALGALGLDYGFGSTFSDLDWTDTPGTLTGVAFAPGAIGLNATAQVNVLSGSSFSFSGIADIVNGADFTINLTVEHDEIIDPPPPPPELIPLPAALPLYGTGLAVMGFLGWRRKRKAAEAA